MSSRRTAILIGAIAIGVLAVLLIVRYVQGIRDEVNAENQSVQVLRAEEEVKRGEDGGQAYDQKKIQPQPMPSKFVPQGYVQTPDAIQKKVALFNIAPGTVIVDGMFVDPATSSISFRERLKNKNHVAISIQVDQVHGVGGFLVPGDEVNMMIYQDNAVIKDALQSTNAQKPQFLPDFGQARALPPENYIKTGGAQWLILGNTARYMFQKVQILAVGSTQLLGPGEQATSGSSGTSGTTSTSTAPNNTGLITFNVPPEAAQWIATGNKGDNGFYLSLVGKDYVPRELKPLPVIVDTLPGEDPAILCPYKYDPDGGC